jgi:hypothetical protein
MYSVYTVQLAGREIQLYSSYMVYQCGPNQPYSLSCLYVHCTVMFSFLSNKLWTRTVQLECYASLCMFYNSILNTPTFYSLKVSQFYASLCMFYNIHMHLFYSLKVSQFHASLCTVQTRAWLTWSSNTLASLNTKWTRRLHTWQKGVRASR